MESENKMSFYLGRVVEVSDKYHAGRIKAAINDDRGAPLSKIPYSFPALPKMLHVMPKVGEAVIIIIDNENRANAQRYSIGPIISQPQKMHFDGYAELSATKMLNHGLMPPDISVDNVPSANGTLPEEEEIAILGRKDSEIILSDNDIRIRCGVRVTDPYKGTISLNGRGNNDNEVTRAEDVNESIKVAPAFIKLKEHTTPINTTHPKSEIKPHSKTVSTATIVADKINLISPNGDGKFHLTGAGEGISDEQMKQIIEKAHRLPYGDVLVEFLSEFLKMFLSHYHPYPGLAPDTAEPVAATFWKKYTTNKNQLEDILLSKDVRIN